jgi:hypothetical protein
MPRSPRLIFPGSKLSPKRAATRMRCPAWRASSSPHRHSRATSSTKIAAATNPPKGQLQALKGKVAISNAKLSTIKNLCGRALAAPRAAGRSDTTAPRASTRTKNKAYSDVLYVDELIGLDTVNTCHRQRWMPTATMAVLAPVLKRM